MKELYEEIKVQNLPPMKKVANPDEMNWQQRSQEGVNREFFLSIRAKSLSQASEKKVVQEEKRHPSIDKCQEEVDYLFS